MSAINRQSCVILLVEDVMADAHLTSAAFKEARFLVDLRHATDGLDALDYLHHRGRWSQGSPRPDLILLDLNMPRMDGREFLSAIKSDMEIASIPVVVLTTSEVERDVLASYQRGASGYIVKPVEIEDFLNAVRQIEDYWLTLVRLPQR
ncbi:Response regulator rcp1 [Magnetospirillum sp. XM-1]|uniref:response regulator n=1 Tax=Magnetospirillum sp. XM-1 TaxID=1663591 RepID=UPI00073DFFCF|nr:response regulator [Magnetospirillum sp. XM-1]CUW37849.1 Response regulator rcp1 [Magnetospirillum sp. XM-1]